MSLSIIICVKSVVMRAPAAELSRTAQASELNPFDRPALTACLELVRESGGSVTVLSMGPEVAEEAIREAMAQGADRGVLVCDRALKGSDTLATSTALAAAIRLLMPADLIVFGARTADSDTGHVGPQTAAALGMPAVTLARVVTPIEGGFRVERQVDGFSEVYEIEAPAAVSIHHLACPATDAPLGGIEDAFSRGVVEKWGLAELGLAAEAVGERGSGTIVKSMRHARQEKKCEFIGGSCEEQAEALAKWLSEKGLVE